MRATWIMITAIVAAVVFGGCQNGQKKPSDNGGQKKKAAVKAAEAEPAYKPAGFDKRGYVTLMHENRIWVFKSGSRELAEFKAGNEPAKNVSMVKAGPAGYTLRSVEPEILQGYIAACEGFETFIVEGRIWVFRPGSEDLATFKKMGEPAKFVIRPKAGPGGMTVKGPDEKTIMEYLTAKDGFVTRYVEGRLWIFLPDSEPLAQFEKMGEPAKHVIRPAAGPNRMTLKAPDMQLIEEYMAAAWGFETFVVEHRIWVFRKGSPEIATFKKMGEPAKHVIRPAAGPLRMTVKAPDTGTMNDYLRVASN